jgi:ATP-binding cassette subfamily B (MDR/TAP) protein 1
MGTAMPAFALLWGDMTDAFMQGGDAMVQASFKVMLKFIYIGIGVFAAGWLMFACWMISGERQSIACRKAYLKSLLRQ